MSILETFVIEATGLHFLKNVSQEFIEIFCIAILNPFLANVLILYPLKASQNLLFSGVFRVYKVGALARNELMSSFSRCSF